MRSSRAIQVIGCHAEGEVGDVIVGGVAPPPGSTVWEQSRFIAADGALREASEEIGVPVRHQEPGGLLMHLDVHPGPKGHTHLDLRYLVRGPEVTPQPADGESTQVGWFGWAEAESMADAGLVGALRAAKALLDLG